MYIGNVMLLIINLPLVPLLAKVLNVPYYVLGPTVVLLCSVGVYSLHNSLFDLWLLLFFSIIGYFMKKLDFPAPPVVLGLVLGPMLEQNLKRSLQMSLGDVSIFFQSPISATLLAVTFLVLVVPLLSKLFKSASSKKASADTV